MNEGKYFFLCAFVPWCEVLLQNKERGNDSGTFRIVTGTIYGSEDTVRVVEGEYE